MNIFLDSDGVCCDFDGHVASFSGGRKPNELGGDANLWALVNSIPDFWSTMPLLPGARDLFDAAKAIDPNVRILTGCPRSGYEAAVEGKLLKHSRYFPGTQVITCLSRNKADHMIAPGDCLVDDMARNIKRWEAAGGTGIRYWSAEQAIEKLRKLAAERGL